MKEMGTFWTVGVVTKPFLSSKGGQRDDPRFDEIDRAWCQTRDSSLIKGHRQRLKC
jgi:hypothetical protein